MITNADIDGTTHTFLALDWMGGEKGKYIISACSNGLQSNTDFVVDRSRVVEVDGSIEAKHYSRVIKQPNVVEEMYASFAAVGTHDHYRQGTLEMESHYKTET